MKRLRGPALVACIALGLSGAMVSAPAIGTTAAAPTPAVLTCAGKVVVRPTSYVLACADANTYFSDIRWTSWGPKTASGAGTFVQNNCAPTCAEGKFLRYPAVLTLSAPKATKLGLLFSAVHYLYAVTAATTLPVTRLADLAPTPARPRCSPNPTVAARDIIPPPPFSVTKVTVQQMALPKGEPTGGGPTLKRLYRVAFTVVHGNAVLAAGHRFTQFAYVTRSSPSASWCFLKGGSAP